MKNIEENVKDLKRVNINLPVSIINRVKDYANKLGLNVTSAYIVLLNQALEQKNSIDQLSLFTSIYNELKSNQNLDELDKLLENTKNGND